MTPEQDQMLREIHGALFNQIPSQSPFRHIGEGAVLQQHQLPINDDGFLHPMWVEWSAKLGDPMNLALLTEVASADPTVHPDRAEDIQLAKLVLQRINTPAPAVAPAVTPNVVPAPVAPPAPAPAPGKNTVGPAGWIGLAGTVIQGLLWVLQATEHLMPAQWAAVVSGLLSVLTGLGIYKAPNSGGNPPAPKPAAEPTPAPAPTPTPPPAPAPAPAAGSMEETLAQTRHDAEHLVQQSEEIRKHLG